MSEGHFRVKSKKNLDELKVGDTISESDFATITPSGDFVQMEYVEADEVETSSKKMKVKPGIYTIQQTMMGLVLNHTEFTKDEILDEFVNTKEIEDKVDCFFNKFDIYYQLGFEVPKRAALLYGPAGTGKSVSISKVCSKYVSDGKTLVLIWNTDKFEAFQVKDLIKNFEYVGVEKMILVAEDIGGMAHENAMVRSESSLLSLLDNKEKTFTKPIFILATTNYPENFMENLTNRPDRFDDKISVSYPNADARVALLKFFDKMNIINEKAVEILSSKKCEKFTPAHIRESIIRSLIYDRSLDTTLDDMIKEIEDYGNQFKGPRRNVGF